MRAGFLVGRIILGLYYLYGGIAGFGKLGMLASHAASKGVPAAGPAVFVAHALLVIAGFCFLTGWRPVWGVIAIALFLIPVTFSMHAFWAETAPAAQQAQLINFTKNLALLGSALMFLAIPRPWAYSLEQATSRRRVPPPGALPA
jgi:uncharacterized membrane protein YphA (DoxX/SURF4 family)